MRRKGMKWHEILAKLDRPGSFVLEVRPLMKAIDPSSVAPSYDRAAKKAATRKRVRRSGSKVATP
jgi:hypothetical protein